MNVYSLKLYDDELVTFTLEKKGLKGLKASILNINTQLNAFIPLDLELNENGILK